VSLCHPGLYEHHDQQEGAADDQLLPTNNVGGSSSIRMILPYNSGPYLTRQTVSCSDLTAVSTGHLRRAYGHHSAKRNPYGLETYL